MTNTQNGASHEQPRRESDEDQDRSSSAQPLLTNNGTCAGTRAVYDPRYRGYRLFVGNLSPECTKSELQGVFARFGSLVQVWVSGHLRFAYVTFVNALDAEKAVEGANGYVLHELAMIVEHPPTSGKDNVCNIGIELYGSVIV